MRSLWLVLGLVSALSALTMTMASCGGGGGDDAPVDAALADARVVDAARPIDAAGPDAAMCKLVRPYSSRDAVCNGCAEAHCGCEINGCLVDTQCDDGYVNCIIACALDPGDAGVPPCMTDCAQQYPRGKVEYDLAIGCVDRACPTECQ